MLYIKQPPKLETPDDLRAALQQAIKLEHATIPAYLTALMTIKPGHNTEIAELLRRVAIEEMLHMCIACNVLNAIGGHPQINTPDFVPTYPGPLPMGIGSDPHGGPPFEVPLKKLSRALIHDVFMVIEEPEHAIAFPVVRAAGPGAGAPEFRTIGQFYDAMIALITAAGPRIFTGDPARQVTGWFSPRDLFAVTDVDSACAGLTRIKRQGEGTAKLPTDGDGGLAHYYIYAEIDKGRRLVRDPQVPEGYSYSGAPIPFDAAGVYPMVDNPPQKTLPPQLEFLADDFDAAYSALLNALHDTFNGAPGHLRVVMGLMYSVKLLGEKLIATPLDAKGEQNAGPRFRYVGRPL